MVRNVAHDCSQIKRRGRPKTTPEEKKLLRRARELRLGVNKGKVCRHPKAVCPLCGVVTRERNMKSHLGACQRRRQARQDELATAWWSRTITAEINADKWRLK